MPIAASDIHLYGSKKTDVGDRLGGALEATDELVDDTVANLFDNVSGAEAADGDTEYRAFFIKNEHATLTWTTVKFWIDSNTTSADDTLRVGIDLAMVAAPVSTGSGDTIADESTAPDPAVTFSTADGVGNALTIGNLEPGHYTMIWVERVVGAAAAAKSANAATFKWTGDTEE